MTAQKHGFNNALMNSAPGTVSEVKLVKKLSASQWSDRNFRYNFELNGPPDREWEMALLKEVAGYAQTTGGEPFDVSFEGTEIHLVCIPANLETRFEYLKKAIADVNARYAQKLEQRARARKQQDEEAAREKAKQADTAKAAHEAFNRLKL